MKYVEGVLKSFIDESAVECLRLARKWRDGPRLLPGQASSLDVEEVRSLVDSSLPQDR
jgi:hypothetical protein